MGCLVPNDLAHDAWCKSGIQPTKNHSIKTPPLHKFRVDFSHGKFLGWAWLGSFDELFKAIGEKFIFHLGFPDDVVVMVKLDREGMIKGLQRGWVGC